MKIFTLSMVGILYACSIYAQTSNEPVPEKSKLSFYGDARTRFEYDWDYINASGKAYR